MIDVSTAITTKTNKYLYTGLTLGFAQTLASSQDDSGLYILRYAVYNDIKAIPINIGRQGSSAVKLLTHAPPKPRSNKSRGPTQQTDATIPATKPPIKGVFIFPDILQTPMTFYHG